LRYKISWESNRLHYTSCFPRDYKGLDEDVAVGFDEDVHEELGDEDHPLEEMVMGADVAPLWRAVTKGAATAPGGSGPLAILLP
jgi:hypothetical protein